MSYVSIPYRSVNPATGETVKEFDTITDGELDAAIGAASVAYKAWRDRPLAERAAVVKAAAEELRTNAAEYAGYLTADMGKLIGTSEAEVGLSAAILDYYADHAEEFLAPRELPESPGAYVETEPIGAILAVEPWNFPYYQVVRVAAPQLVAGNVVILKHAEGVPQCALALARLFEKAGAPQGVYTNIFATHEQVGRAIDDPRIAAVTVTGSVRAGSAIAERAGRHLKKVVAELGSNDPLIVLEDADLDHAVGGALFGRLFNTGQTCVASKRIIVVGQERGREFLEKFKAGLESLVPGDPSVPETTLGPLASEGALNLLLKQVDLATKGGARVVIGGRKLDRPGFYIEPTILTDIDEKNPAFTEEYFGPVASYFVVDSEDEAFALANNTPYGLGAAIFTANLDRSRELAKQVESGMVFINQPAWTSAELPFGGTKGSGFGRELGEAGFGEFVNRKTVNVAAVGAPPWGPAPA